MKPYADRIVSMRRSGIREVMDLAAGHPDVIHLEVGEPDFATPDHILAAGARAGYDGFTKYTANRGILSLREAISAKLERSNGIAATPDQVVVTAGGVNAILASLVALVEPGETILLPSLGWPNYEMMAAVLHAEVRRYPLLSERDFEPDFDALDALAEDGRAKVLIVNSPSNPTGAVWGPEAVARVLEIATRHDLWVVSDEVYEDIVFDGLHVSPATLDGDGRVISTFSLSKTYAMTGWRIGYAVTTPALAALIGKVQEPIVSCPTAVAQKAAEAAIDGPQDCVALMREAYRERRDAAVDLLRAAGMLVTVPHGAFYVLADVSRAGLDSYAIARRLVAEHRVAVAPGETFGPSGAGLVRISLATRRDLLEEGIGRLARAMETWSA